MQKPWSVPANHEVANKYFKVLRAHEEIHRLNIEIRRLDAWTTHEDEVFKSAMDSADPHLAAEIHRCYAEWRCVNHLHRIRISSIYCLEGYSGPGPFVPEENMGENQLGSGEELLDEDDDLEDEVLWLGDFLDSITIN